MKHNADDQMYLISIHYQTGNSFDTYEETEYVGVSWDDINIAKENLKRIENHYRFVESQYEYISEEEFNKIKNIPVGVGYNKEIKCITLVLIDDKRNEINCHAFWVGHFERLHTAKIVLNLPEFNAY